MGLDVKGLEELSRDLIRLADEYPRTAEQGLTTIGNRLKKECRKNTPVGETGKLSRSWRHKVSGYSGSDLVYELWNRHPVHHLLNNGHVQKTRGGRTTGYYEGQHYTEKSVKRFEGTELKQALEKFAKRLLRKAGRR